MDAWVFWLIATVVLAVGEILTTSLVLGMIAGGTAAAAVVAGLGLGLGWQLSAFTVVSIGLVLGVRPVARRHLQTPRSIRTGVAALVGNDAEVLEAVDARDGRVKIGGEIWSARAYDGESAYDVGTVVHVVKIAGATALVG